MQHTGSLYAFVDALHGACHGMRRHTGGDTTFGIGAFAADPKM